MVVLECTGNQVPGVSHLVLLKFLGVPPSLKSPYAGAAVGLALPPPMHSRLSFAIYCSSRRRRALNPTVLDRQRIVVSSERRDDEEI